MENTQLSNTIPTKIKGLSVGIVIMLLAIVLFIFIAKNLNDPHSFVLLMDQQLRVWMQSCITPERTTFFRFITHWHNTAGILTMTAMFALWLAYKRAWLWMLQVLLLIPSGMVFNTLLKNSFQRPRPRPPIDHPILTSMSYSFPSGHTASTTLLYVMLSLWLLTVLKPK